MSTFVISLLDSLSIKGITPDSIRKTTGSCFSSTYIIHALEPLFLKLGGPDAELAFKGEYYGLQAISETNSIMCPRPISVGMFNGKSYLLMTQLKDLSGNTSGLGRHLAAMHKDSVAEKFGFPYRTFCGSTELDNTQTSQSWPEWFAEHRINDILLKLECVGTLDKVLPKGITRQSVVGRVRDKLLTLAPSAIPMLLHGDLWGGNAGSSGGVPCIYDPACYYGDNEVDLAMTQLFGGFDSNFLRDYDSILPISPEFEKKIPIYNLFHILNHALMFGGGYCHEARTLIAQL
ncbi:Fructosamine-3-kinase [Giardia lamblia P15]|uniref:protein-ribulosamine 3-kinase n=1 Tax=Giardia intestinalis (strain P15) TaxID=658858 RepID=E1F327_GIAIA|nr:Fructosamine-3-kinase [Giardia lamblia P15]